MSHGRNHGSRVRWRLRRQDFFWCEPSRWRRAPLGATKTDLSRRTLAMEARQQQPAWLCTEGITSGDVVQRVCPLLLERLRRQAADKGMRPLFGRDGADPETAVLVGLLSETCNNFGPFRDEEVLVTKDQARIQKPGDSPHFNELTTGGGLPNWEIDQLFRAPWRCFNEQLHSLQWVPQYPTTAVDERLYPGTYRVAQTTLECLGDQPIGIMAPRRPANRDPRRGALGQCHLLLPRPRLVRHLLPACPCLYGSQAGRYPTVELLPLQPRRPQLLEPLEGGGRVGPAGEVASGLGRSRPDIPPQRHRGLLQPRWGRLRGLHHGLGSCGLNRRRPPHPGARATAARPLAEADGSSRSRRA